MARRVVKELKISQEEECHFCQISRLVRDGTRSRRMMKCRQIFYPRKLDLEAGQGTWYRLTLAQAANKATDIEKLMQGHVA